MYNPSLKMYSPKVLSKVEAVLRSTIKAAYYWRREKFETSTITFPKSSYSHYYLHITWSWCSSNTHIKVISVWWFTFFCLVKILKSLKEKKNNENNCKGDYIWINSIAVKITRQTVPILQKSRVCLLTPFPLFDFL